MKTAILKHNYPCSNFKPMDIITPRLVPWRPWQILRGPCGHNLIRTEKNTFIGYLEIYTSYSGVADEEQNKVLDIYNGRFWVVLFGVGG